MANRVNRNGLHAHGGHTQHANDPPYPIHLKPPHPLLLRQLDCLAGGCLARVSSIYAPTAIASRGNPQRVSASRRHDHLALAASAAPACACASMTTPTVEL